jgi:hypothetical protein
VDSPIADLPVHIGSHRHSSRGYLPDYRAYLLGLHGHFEKSIDLICEDDDHAKLRAEQLVDGHDVELWQSERRVATFKREPE